MLRVADKSFLFLLSFDMSSRQEDYWYDSQIKKDAASRFQMGLHNIEEIQEDLAKLSSNWGNEADFPSADDYSSLGIESDDFEVVQWENETQIKSARFCNSTIPNKFSSATEIAKLQAEVQHLQRSAKEQPAIHHVVLNLINDKPCSLENYRSREDKIAILDQAILFADGNAILRAVLHFWKTTKSSIFYPELMKRPVAIHHYLNYLRIHKKFSELEDFLGMQGDSYEAAMLGYKIALNKQNSDSVIKHLQFCLTNYFSKDPSLANETALITDHLSLLERQLPIEEADKKSLKDGSMEVVRVMSLPHRSLIDTLYYCCLYHYGEKETHFPSPENLRKYFNISDKQYDYTRIVATAEQKSWKQLDQIIFTKSYLGGNKIKSDLNIERILQILHRKGAPIEVLSKYLPYIENLERRLELAKTYKSQTLIIETLVRLKDRHGLDLMKSKFPIHSKEHSLIDEALRRTDVKWKS